MRDAELVLASGGQGEYLKKRVKRVLKSPFFPRGVKKVNQLLTPE